jgi:hypothetical protein
MKAKAQECAEGTSKMIEVEPDVFFVDDLTDKYIEEKSDSGKSKANKTEIVPKVMDEIKRLLENGVTKRDELESLIKKNCGYKVFPGPGFYLNHVRCVLENMGRESLVTKTITELIKDCLQSGGKRRDKIYDEMATIHGSAFTLKYGKTDLRKALSCSTYVLF